jgi:hypothetical protein
MYLYSCDDSLGTGNPCPNYSKIGVPKGVLIDIWGEKWVKVLHKLKFYFKQYKSSVKPLVIH